MVIKRDRYHASAQPSIVLVSEEKLMPSLIICEQLAERMHEAALDFLVRIVEVVCEKIRIKILDGQISSLIHECNRCRTYIV